MEMYNNYLLTHSFKGVRLCAAWRWGAVQGSARPEVRGTAEPHGGAYPP